MQNDQPEQDRAKAIKVAWRNWFLIFIPLSLVIVIADFFLDFKIVASLLAAFLALTLLYQRYVKKRTWHSILWGVYASDSEA